MNHPDSVHYSKPRWVAQFRISAIADTEIRLDWTIGYNNDIPSSSTIHLNSKWPTLG